MPSDAPKRDPRNRPLPGDILTMGGCRREVKEGVGSAKVVTFHEIQFGSNVAYLRDAKMQAWRNWARDARVIHAAD
jgi:hypothetical protein